jgi:hypothetical protein
MVVSALLCGCVSYTGLKVEEPGFGKTVADLQPTLQWQAMKDATYDLVIYQPDLADERQAVAAPEQRAYYREGLTSNVHKVESKLEAGRQYLWSVRTRKDGKVSAWTNHKMVVEALVVRETRVRLPRFKTPNP